MNWYRHDLTGVTPTPLAGYLKGLGVLRIVTEQLDPDARASWRGGAFTLLSRHSLDGICDFFASAYRPTAIATPWNADGGFLGKPGVEVKALMEAGALRELGDRFNQYLEGLDRAAASVAGRSDSPKDDEKLNVFTTARSTWSDAELDWLDAVVAVLPDQDKARYPALLASGGCDGRLDFGSTFRRRLVSLFAGGKKGPSDDDLRAWVRTALVGAAVPKLPSDSAGQFDPGSTSFVNGGFGYRGKSTVNPWDFVLAFEGIPVMKVAVVRRLRSDFVTISSPFSVRGVAAGYASASSKDGDGRGEQWLPLWDGAATLDEVRAMFNEGRMMSGGRVAGTALEAARAIARVGVARGITAFERYGYVPRNGQSSLAVPLGRWPVRANPRVRLLDELDAWLARLSSKAGDKNAPASLSRDVRRLESAMMEVCRENAGPHRWQALIIALGETEQNLAARPKFTAGAYLPPAPRLSLAWLEACADGTAEVRIAASLGLSGLPGSMVSLGGKALGPVRSHAVPLDATRAWRAFRTTEGGLAKDPSVCWTGRELVSDLAALVTRRIIEADRLGIDGFALDGPLPVSRPDLAAFIVGSVDDSRVGRLARAFMLLDGNSPVPENIGDLLGRAPAGIVPPSFGLVRLTHLPRPLQLDGGLTLPASTDARIVRLLQAGHGRAAFELARQRLRGRGLTSRLRMALAAPVEARRMAAALALPVAASTLRYLASIVANPFRDDDVPSRSIHYTSEDSNSNQG